MKDKYGKRLSEGSWLMSITEDHPGEILPVVKEYGELCFPECTGLTCGIPLTDFRMQDGCLQDFIKVDNPYEAKPRYKTAVKAFPNVELQDAGRMRMVDLEEVSTESFAKLCGLGGFEGADRYETVCCDILALSRADINADELDSDDDYWDDEIADDVLSVFLKDAEHYLVFASGCRWNGDSGYTITDKRRDVVRRDYDTVIVPYAGTSQGKILVCRESSNDVPTGSTTIIVALTDAEYARLRDAEFSAVSNFAWKQHNKAVKTA